MKKLFKYALAFVFLALTGCEKDSNEQHETKTESAVPFEKKLINANELPADIQQYINTDGTKNSSKSTNAETLNEPIFMMHDIVSMTDDKNITNYSISFFYPDTPENVYYNLVINVLPTGESKKYIFKYICNPEDFENFKAHRFDFKYFDGTTEISQVNYITSGKFTSKSSAGDDPCNKIFVPSPSDPKSNPAAGGGSGNGGNPAPGGFNTSVPGYNSPPSSGGYTGGGDGSSGHDHSNCYGSNGQYWYYAGDVRPPHPHTSKSAGPCPEVTPPTGYVPVNTMPLIKILGTQLKLSIAQIAFLRNRPDTMNIIGSYLNSNNFSEEAKSFCKEIIDQSILNPSLHFDILASANSPMNIDKSSITNDTPEGKKFNTIYNALITSPEFKKLFIDIFQNNSRFNVKFEIEEHVYEDNNPSKKEVNATTSQLSGANNIVIKINKQILISGTDKSQTNIENAKTILHECIHAYLFIKASNPAIGADFVKILNTMYPTVSEQHDFMYDKMIPTMQKVLSEIRDLVTTATKRANIEQYILHPTLKPLTTTTFSWFNFYFYLSLNGLQSTYCFTQDFQYPSDKYSLYKQYIDAGSIELDR
ncbi:hypothetical protein B0A80_09900 [Flavobacterium tructae]|nr:hypothetical protein [Flavobacterium tructae]OXB23535.1 hypothetical protein B0A80_09900 [Flavobacterium tructae]